MLKTEAIVLNHVSQKSFAALCRRTAAAFLSVTMLSGMVVAGAADELTTALPEPAGQEQAGFEATTFSLTESARSMDFNDDWRFQLKDEEASAKEYNDQAWRKLSLPHDWSIEQDFTHDVSSEIGHLPGGTGWYRKHFTLPKEFEGKRINIDFDGVYMDSYIYVNGKKVGNYPNGYLPFSFDITDYVVCDGKTDNVIAVKVTNITQKGNVANQSSRWYSGSGIYRDVHMTVTDPVHVAQYGTSFYTNSIAKEYASGKVTIDATTTVENESDTEANVVVKHTIYEYNTENVFYTSEQSPPQPVTAKGKADIVQQFQVANPKLWSVDDPNLYTIKTEVLVDGAVRDTYETRFGFTWSEFDKDKGFTLNGQPMKLYGVCMHHDQGALGAVDTPAAIRRQMRIMKEMGVNSIRVTHNPASPDLLRICDEMGLTVIEEAFDTWYSGKKNYDYHRFFEQPCTYPGVEQGTTWAKFDLQQMIRSNRNYPSIIMWSLGNEIGETNDGSKGLKTVRELKAWAKEIDKAHPVTMGEDKFRMNQTTTGSFVQVANELDVVGMNYAESNYDYYRQNFPNWTIYGSETSSAIKSRGYYAYPERNRRDNGDHAHNAADNQLSSYDNSAVPWGKTASDSWIPDRDRPWIQGEYIWTGFDYIGEPTPWNQDYNALPKSSYFGIVDTAGFPKDDYYLYQSQWLNVKSDPIVHILPHWNWENAEMRAKVTKSNGKIPVRVYSNAAKVELFVNDQSKGEKVFHVTDKGFQQQSKDSDRLYLEWELPWDETNNKEGTTIVAKAKDASGKVIQEDRIVTAGSPAKLSASVDRQVIDADGYDLAYITIDVLDANGNFVPTAMNQLNFTISGNGKIVGVDNGDPASWERYKDSNGVWKRKAFNGKAVVIVQSTKDAGKFTLTARSAGLEQTSATVYTSADKVDGDKILGYETQNIQTDIGQVPALPTTIKAVYANGTTTEVGVNWEPVNAEQLTQPAEIIVNGTVQDTGEAVTMKIIVRGPSGIRPVSVVTLINERPQLPKEVTVVWSDGKTETKQIDKWEELPADKLAVPGQYTITGTVKDSTMRATANIRVVAEAQKSNIALSSFGTEVKVSYQEGTHYPNQLIDGNLTIENGWGNWESTSRLADDATLTFNKEYSIDSVNVWISEQKSWQKPDRITVQYWDAQRNDFVDVANQSQKDNFVGWADAGAEYTGNEITFDPVTTSKLKFNFALDQYNSDKNMMKIIELQAFSKVLVADNSAKLTDLRVNDVPVEGFQPDVTGYFIITDFKDKIPVVTAVAEGNAAVFIRQPLSNDGTAVVEVTSEDGRSTTTYTIQFSRGDAQLESVTLKVPSEVKEDDRVKLSAEGRLQNGHTIPNNKVTITYAVADGTGHAMIEKDELLAYTAGTVSVTATMEYLGKQVTSAPVELTIAANSDKKQIVSFNPVAVNTAPNEAPKLPERVTANYDKGLPREMEVVWDVIDPKLYAESNTFTVNGRIAEPSTLQPTAQINVVDAVAAENIAIPIPEGFEVVLPKQTTVYFSDGTKKLLDVEWAQAENLPVEQPEPQPEPPVQVQPEPPVQVQPEPPALPEQQPAEPQEQIEQNQQPEQIPDAPTSDAVDAPADTQDAEPSSPVENIAGSDKEPLGVKLDTAVDLAAQGEQTVYHGTVSYAGDKLSVTATVRTAPSEKSQNYIIMRNGYDLPVGIASYTNDVTVDAASNDSARNLNDGNKDFTVSDSKKIWSNWMKNGQQRPEDWVSVTIANEGTRDARVVDTVSVGFFDEKGGANSIKLPAAYFVEYYTGPMDYELKDLNRSGNVAQFGETHPLNNAANWKEVSYKGSKPQVTGDKMLDIEFAPVKTHLVRVRMQAQSGYCLGVNELEAYGKTAKGADTFAVNGIKVGGVDRLGEFADKTLSVDLAGAGFPEITATATDNAAVTVIPASVQNPVALVRFVPESGKETAIEEYKIHFAGAANPLQTSSVTFDSNGGSIVAGQTIVKGNTIAAPTEPTRSGYNFRGWYTADGTMFDFSTAINESVALRAEWDKRGGGGSSKPAPSKPGKPIVAVLDNGGKIEADENGNVTIKPDAGYRVADVVVNGVSKGPVTSLSGLDKNDKVVVKFEKIPATRPETSGFGDVAASSWYADAVNFVVSRELFNGTSANSFSPNKTMTRGMLVTVLHRLAGKPTIAENGKFTDVGKSYYTDAVNWAVANGVVNGVNDRQFAPNAQISREQMATILYRYASKMKLDVSESNALTGYGDAAAVSGYAKKAMQWANAAKLVNGTNEMKLNPKGSATRAEVAAILMRFCEKYSL